MFNLRDPRFSKSQLDQIYRYVYLMGYTLEISQDPEMINKGKQYKMYNNDLSLYVFLQSSNFRKEVTAIYKTSKTNISDALYMAEFFNIQNGKKSEYKDLPLEKQTKLTINKNLFNHAKDLFDIEWFRYNRNIKQSLSINKKSIVRQDQQNTSVFASMLPAFG
jgi:hypothetical protein